jgi:hypothetical protein
MEFSEFTPSTPTTLKCFRNSQFCNRKPRPCFYGGAAMYWRLLQGRSCARNTGNEASLVESLIALKVSEGERARVLHDQRTFIRERRSCLT